MAKREGWKSLPVDVPDFIHELFEQLRDEYGDSHGVAPSQGQTVSALAYVANVESLEAALKSYRDECKRRGAGHI
jgi:hypothetical protein